MKPRVPLAHLPWHVVEDRYRPDDNIYWETVTTLANGYMGARGCPEEGFPGEMETYPGCYVAGVFDNFEGHLVELVNVPDFFGMRITIGGQPLDLRRGRVAGYRRTLDMRNGLLERRFTWTAPGGAATEIVFERFLSLADPHLACQRVRLTPRNHAKPVTITSGLDGTVFNRKQRDWPPLTRVIRNQHLAADGAGRRGRDGQWLAVRTLTTGVRLVEAARYAAVGPAKVSTAVAPMQVASTWRFAGARGRTVGLDKVVAVWTSRDATAAKLPALARGSADRGLAAGHDALRLAHAKAWQARWRDIDIRIDGDDGAQQGLRFNLFQLAAANARNDSGVNLAAKLLSHTRYKGNCFWDTEIFMFPFFCYADPHAARHLLLYRYRMLPAARKRAKDHWLPGAMYPWMSAHDGSEQCDSWEYGECEIHITADVAHAFDQYLRATGDEDFFVRYAAEVFVETARFWAARVAWNPRRKRYTILSVKGPDEYCSITNNNQFTNYLAMANLELAERAVARMREDHPAAWRKLAGRLRFKPSEVARWRDVRRKMFVNWQGDLLIQDDTFLDKETDPLAKYADRKKPLVEIMPYERIMRVKLLRQTDVVLLMYLLGDRFTRRQKLAAYRFYEPLTTHDSSLSYNTHSIAAAELGMVKPAYDYFRKCCRLDLDDELRTAKSGIHGASLGGTWQTVVNGFGGMRVTADGRLTFAPLLPKHWKSLEFSVAFRGRRIGVRVTPAGTSFSLLSGAPVNVRLNGKELRVG